MMESVLQLFNDFTLKNILDELIITAIGATTSWLILKSYQQAKQFRNFVKKQTERDEKQDLKQAQWQADFERKLKNRDIRSDYFERQRLIAFQQIRKYAQQARDDAREMNYPSWIKDDATWSEKLLKDYEKILDLLHEHALLLEYFGNYAEVHSFKNALLNFYLITRKYAPSNKDNKKVLQTEYAKFSDCFKKLISKVKYITDSSSEES